MKIEASGTNVMAQTICQQNFLGCFIASGSSLYNLQKSYLTNGIQATCFEPLI